jgi:hypothetical protein
MCLEPSRNPIIDISPDCGRYVWKCSAECICTVHVRTSSKAQIIYSVEWKDE